MPTSYNYDLTAVSAASYIPTMNKGITLNRSLTSAGSATFVVKLGLILSVASAITITFSNVKNIIFLVFATTFSSIIKQNVLSQLLNVYTDSIASLIPLIDKILLATFGPTAVFVRSITKSFVPSIGSTVSILRDAVKEMFIGTQSRVLLRKAYELPGLLTTPFSEAVASFVRSFPVTVSATSSVTSSIKKWMLKVISSTSSVTATLINKGVLVLLAVSQVYGLSVRINNLSAILVSNAIANPKFIRSINLIKDLSATIITTIVNSILKPLSVASSVTNTLYKKLYSTLLVNSYVVKYVLRGQTLFKTMYPIAVGNPIISKATTLILTYLVSMNVASNVIYTLTNINYIAQTYSQTLLAVSPVNYSLVKQLNKTFTLTISSVISLIRSWG